MLKSDPVIVDFDTIEDCDSKYLPSSFDGDILFLLPLIALGVPSVYDRSMGGMDKVCDKHL